MSEIEKLRQKASLIGVDVDALVDEIGTVLVDRVVQALPAPQVDLNEIVERLKEFMPVGGPEFDIVALQTTILEKAGERIDEAFSVLATDLKERLDVIRQEGRDGLDGAIEAKLLQYKAQLAGAVKEAIGAGSDGKGQGQGLGQGVPGDRWGMALNVLDRFLDRQDPLSNIENLSTIYARLGNIFGGGPDPTTQFKSNQQIFIEGIKIGAKAKGGVANASPLSSSQPAGRSIKRVRPSTHIDKIIRDL